MLHLIIMRLEFNASKFNLKRFEFGKCLGR